MKSFSMKAFTTIELLIIVVTLIIFGTGSVVVWRKKMQPLPSPTLPLIPTLTPTHQITVPPTSNPRQTDTEATICTNTEGCSSYCGGCPSLCPRIQLSPDQRVNIKDTGLSIALLNITASKEDCFTCPVTIELEVKSGAKTEKITFQVPGFGTKECGSHRVKDIFGFKILLGPVSPDEIELQVWRL